MEVGLSLRGDLAVLARVACNETNLHPQMCCTKRQAHRRKFPFLSVGVLPCGLLSCSPDVDIWCNKGSQMHWKAGRICKQPSLEASIHCLRSAEANS